MTRSATTSEPVRPSCAQIVVEFVVGRGVTRSESAEIGLRVVLETLPRLPERGRS